MKNTAIDPRTQIGRVGLVVRDLARSANYYQHQIGLDLQQRTSGHAVLGAGGKELLVLDEQPGAKPVQPGRTGLYHFAILVPSRLELARTLRHLIESKTRIDGASDHG